MTRDIYTLIENYMISCMGDSAHDKEHVYRVLYNAMEIASQEKDVDYDILITSCLLHDIGRKEQFDNPRICHAEAGARKAYSFLLANGFDKLFAEEVALCIWCHRYRGNNIPKSVEAKILFDADKLDVTGAVGIARTLLYKGKMAEPLYTLTSEGEVSDGEKDTAPSFFQEYKFKLETLYDKFYTEYGAELARERQKAAVSFYENLLAEVSGSYRQGRDALEKHINTAK